MSGELGTIALACQECLTPLESSTTTDGDGGLLELVKPCPRCRLRIVKHVAAPATEPPPPATISPTSRARGNWSRFDAQGRRVCVICNTPLEVRKHGRGCQPRFCPTHRDPKNRDRK